MKIKLSLVFLLVSMSVMGQSNVGLPPRWLSDTPIPLNPSFVYKVESAISTDLNTARKICFQELISDSAMRNGAVVTNDMQMGIKVQQQAENGVIVENTKIEGDFNTNIDTKEVALYVNKIDEYWKMDKSGKYELYVLYARSEPWHTPNFDDVIITDFYGFEAGWRSAVVPGWGQFHKGDYKKGALMLGGTLALASGIVLTEATRADYQQKYGLTHDAGARKEYLNRHNHWELARNICIGALAGFYIYNIVDAFNAPGARYVVVRRTDRGGRTYAFAPALTPEGYPAAAASITF